MLAVAKETDVWDSEPINPIPSFHKHFVLILFALKFAIRPHFMNFRILNLFCPFSFLQFKTRENTSYEIF